MEKKFDVVCVGAGIADLPLRPVSKEIFEVESYPVDGIQMVIGGDAVNEATILSRLGYRTALVSCVGDDVVGQFVLEHCRQNGIDTSRVKVSSEYATSINVGLVTADGERTFVSNRQGSLWRFRPEDVELDILEEGRILSFASIFNHPLFGGPALEALFARAREAGMVICADMIKPRQGETLEEIREALSYVDYFFPNYDEASLLAGRTEVEEIADVFLECGVKHVIIKTGKKGCFAKGGQESMRVPAYPRSLCVDTIGAGDNFVSGFICGLLEGRSLRFCAEFANAVASISVEASGATAGVRDQEQARRRYREYQRFLAEEQEKTRTAAKETVRAE